jgi:hypothetical protein
MAAIASASVGDYIAPDLNQKMAAVSPAEPLPVIVAWWQRHGRLPPPLDSSGCTTAPGTPTPRARDLGAILGLLGLLVIAGMAAATRRIPHLWSQPMRPSDLNRSAPRCYRPPVSPRPSSKMRARTRGRAGPGRSALAVRSARSPSVSTSTRFATPGAPSAKQFESGQCPGFFGRLSTTTHTFTHG